jgi:hypothetical protein
MRKSGKTPAAQYDAWEVDLEIGAQTQLTFFKYFYMGYITYFPDDERFIYYGELPEAFPGLELSKESFRKHQELIKQEQMKKKVGIGGVITMKRGDLLPYRQYNFGKGFIAERPLLSQNGSMLIFEKAASAGKFYLYSPDGNHKHVGGGGSIDSAAISQDGKLLGVCYSVSMTIFKVADGSRYRIIFLPSETKYIKNWDDEMRKNQEKLKVMPEKPS